MKRALEINFAWKHWLNGFFRSVLIAAICTLIGWAMTHSSVGWQDALKFLASSTGGLFITFLGSNPMPDLFPEQPPQTETGAPPPNSPGGRAITINQI